MTTSSPQSLTDLRRLLRSGLVIPAHPLALTSERKLDERRQRALTRYYVAAGAGGIAVGVHTTQFAIRKPEIGLLQPVLELAAETARQSPHPPVLIAGVCGATAQALQEARLAASLGYHAGLLSLAALQDATVDELIAHAREVAQVLPVVGFYLQPAVGGRLLGYEFWRRFAQIENVVAIKIAPFNRYQTLDVLHAVADSGREADVALYTGNDDNIIPDLLTRFEFPVNGRSVSLRITGGLLGQWAVWTHRAVELLEQIKACVTHEDFHVQKWLTLGAQLTDANSSIFDAANSFHGCIPGIHEILRRQGLLENLITLDPDEHLSPGQLQQIDRICHAYPHLTDDTFVQAHRDKWLA
ncbi:MAG: dihydrodipicolinate synthase family protein [Armatimonadetes bacterium]|nr:dihydrodipicolinate synthase family protein [Armatimonadota bacterium]